MTFLSGCASSLDAWHNYNKKRSQCWMPQSLSDRWLLLLGCFRMHDINCHLHRAGNTAGRGGYNLESAKVPQGQCPFAGITFDYMQIAGLTCRNHNSQSCETPTTSSSSRSIHLPVQVSQRDYLQVWPCNLCVLVRQVWGFWSTKRG